MRFPESWKRSVARMVRWPPMHQAMLWGIRATVPRHRVGVGVVAMDDDDRVLMLNHVFHPHTPWGLPGGWMERNETPQSCASRELQEETGLVATVGPVVHATYDPQMMCVNLAFLAHLQPAPLTLSSEILTARWFTIDALPSPILTFTRQAIQAAVAVRTSDQRLYEGVTR